jgi:hypothetical protein
MPALTFATPTTAASQGSRLVEASVGRHSEKPSVFCENFPTLPKIELHARGVVLRPGWDVWGLEAPSSAELRRPDAGLRQEMFDRLAQGRRHQFGWDEPTRCRHQDRLPGVSTTPTFVGVAIGVSVSFIATFLHSSCLGRPFR